MATPSFWFLLEAAPGYALFEVTSMEEIGSTSEQVQSQLDDFSTFSRAIKLVAFRPFQNTEEALDNCLKISEGELTEELRSFLETSLPKKVSKKEKDRYLGISDPKLASSIQDTLEFPCRSNEIINELLRGARLHLTRIVKGLAQGEKVMERAQLGLGHAYSRARVKFNVNRQDNMIIQAIQLLDQMDKDVNTAAMRAKEWYGWHFPEMAKLVPDVFQYSRLINVIGNKSSFLARKDDEEDEEYEQSRLEKITKVTMDEEISKKIFEAAKSSMGFDVSDIDMANISHFADRVEALSKYRMELHAYLQNKMELVAPNINALLGEAVGARLIAHAGSLTKLSKCPASTVQILGAEKALFRALKSKGNTPKFGLLFNSTFISRAGPKNKGRISRYLANKCAIASRLDAFSDQPTPAYGTKLREQVEERLQFYETGQVPKKNIDVMLEVKKQLEEGSNKSAKKSKKRPAADEEEQPEAKSEKKKSKKDKTSEERRNDDEEPMDVVSEKKEKKQKKKKKSKSEEDDDE
jgi:nucleolar protein 56